MIIWLASYPRSGNTLLRTICRRCFGIYSSSDEPVRRESEFRRNPDLIGHKEYAEPWDSFYERASSSPDVYLVKTHRNPIDTQPFIYVIRDGRAALQSYRKFHRDYNDRNVSLVSLILGLDPYGGWSDHYHQWNDRTGLKKISVRFEQLVDVTFDQLQTIAAFVGYEKEIRPWENPLNQLKKYEPNFFNDRAMQFQPDADWTEAVSFLFRALHGALMDRLGYGLDGASAVPETLKAVLREIRELIGSLKTENDHLMSICNERQDLIERLQVVCEERLELINRLHGKMNASGGADF